MAQFPEFSQQYVQRLGGTVDALGQVVADFDRSAQSAGLTRASALEELQGGAFLDLRGDDMRRTIERHERLAASLTLLRQERAAGRLALAYGAFDTEIAAATYDDYRPALPVTVEGVVFALGGFVVGFFGFSAFGRLFGRKRKEVV